MTLPGVTGLAGSGTQTFTYDPLGRITASSGLTGAANTYEYDASSNRTKAIENGVETLYTFDRTNELRTRKVGTETARTATYDAFGNLTALPGEGAGAPSTVLAYDLADRLVTMDGPTEPAITFTIDALGRTRTRQVGACTAETLHYLGTTDAVVRIGAGGTPVDAALDPSGTRLATRGSGGSPSFLLPDLHGNVAALFDQATAGYGAPFRYDPYGELLSSPPTGSTRTPWRYQGRMLEGEATDPELYDFGFRSYAADLGAFASLDSVAGSAGDPRSLNRFLYAHANPTTLVDPDGHLAFMLLVPLLAPIPRRPLP